MKLFKHQQDLLDLNPARHLLAWTCGTGKTLAVIKLALQNKQVALVVCPKSIKDMWLEEAPGSWLIKTKEEFRKEHLTLPKFNCVIFDEVHYFSGPTSQMFKGALKYLATHKPEYIYPLTATPYLSTPWNIHTLARLLGHKWHYQKFRDTFFTYVRMGPRMVPVINKYVNITDKTGYKVIGRMPVEDKIAEYVKLLGNTVSMEEVVDVPEQIYQKETFELTGAQKRAIRDVQEDMDVTHIVKWTKIHQICGGALKGDGYVDHQFFKCDKLNRLLDLVGEHKQLTIVCRYNNEVAMIKSAIEKKYKDKPVFLMTGKTKEYKLAQKQEECVLIANAAVSEGWEFPTCPIMIFYSYDFSLKNYVQMKGRIQRANNIKKNVYLSLVMKKTIDEDVYRSIQKKKTFDLAIYKL
jgi:ERCC4-related helicase